MARAGDVLENPATGDRLVFLQTAAETNGELLEYELTFVPSGFAVRNHLHPRQEERHEVLDGSLGIVVAGRERRLEAGHLPPPPRARRPPSRRLSSRRSPRSADCAATALATRRRAVAGEYVFVDEWDVD